MTPDQITLVQTSFGVAAEASDDLVDDFYTRLLTESEESITSLFPADMSVQMGKMGATLTAVVANLEDSDWLVANVVPLGALHVAVGVEPEMFDPVVGVLAATIAANCGDQWSDETAAAWGLALAALKGLFMDGMNGAQPQGAPS